jgi:RNA polymerase sigma-70 factor (ECF subfamily)
MTMENGASTADEVSLVAQARQDPAAFGVLYERYAKKIYNYIYYRTGNHHDAEDLTARTFQRALDNIGHYKERGAPFSAWLYRIAHNLVANWHRDHSRRRVIALDEMEFSSDGLSVHLEAPELAAENNEARRRLLSIIHRLPPERQQLLILKFAERMSNADIGKIMGRSEGAIKSLYHRTLTALRDELEAAGLSITLERTDDQDSD